MRYDIILFVLKANFINILELHKVYSVYNNKNYVYIR